MENKKIKIAVAGTGYVGLSIATLLSQHHEVVAVDVIPEKVELINSRRPPEPHPSYNRASWHRQPTPEYQPDHPVRHSSQP